MGNGRSSLAGLLATVAAASIQSWLPNSRIPRIAAKETHKHGTSVDPNELVHVQVKAGETGYTTAGPRRPGHLAAAPGRP
jgi:hypothetical protein